MQKNKKILLFVFIDYIFYLFDYIICRAELRRDKLCAAKDGKIFLPRAPKQRLHRSPHQDADAAAAPSARCSAARPPALCRSTPCAPDSRRRRKFIRTFARLPQRERSLCAARSVQPLDTFARGVYLMGIKPPRGGGVDFLYENTFRHTIAGCGLCGAFFYIRRR